MSRFTAVGTAVIERVTRDPGSLGEVVWKLRSRLGAGRHRRRIAEYAPMASLPTGGLATLLGVDGGRVEAVMAEVALQDVIAELHAYTIPAQARSMGGAAFLEACYAVVRIVQPTVVLETGVAHGYSTAVLLRALCENGSGTLFSVDLPMFRRGTIPYTGRAVPERLRSEETWELHLGSDRRVLPSLLRRTGPVDVLFYDSDTSYNGMRHTWGLVWPHLRPGGVMMLNLVQTNDAFIEFAEERRLAPILIAQPKRAGAYPRARRPDEHASYLGLLRKPLV